MIQKKKDYKAFTLIELLIVISIIGILATVVLVNLSNAQARAKMSSSKAELRQLASLFHQEFANTGSYAGLNYNNWVGGTGNTADCNTVPLSSTSYAADYRRICNSVISRIDSVSTSNRWIVGNGGLGNSYFSIMVKIDEVGGYATAGTWFCIGSSGRTYEGPYNDSGPGCYFNP